MTSEQEKTIREKWKSLRSEHRSRFDHSVDTYLQCASPDIGTDAVVIGWNDMFLCIEPDGYSHS